MAPILMVDIEKLLKHLGLGHHIETFRANDIDGAALLQHCAESGCGALDHQRTSVDGLYAIGDVIEGLDQISCAMGHAAIAATAIHNRLRKYA